MNSSDLSMSVNEYEMNLKRIKECSLKLYEKFKDDIMSIGYNNITNVIIIYFEKKKNIKKIKFEIPKEYEGYRVDVEFLGKVKPL